MKKLYGILLLALGGAIALTGCTGKLEQRLDQQAQQIRTLQAQLNGVQPAQADTWAQVQSLRQEMQSVQGQIDDFNHATASAGGLTGLARRVDRHEVALQTVNSQFGLDLVLDTNPVVPDDAALPGAETSVAAPAAAAAPVVANPAAQPAAQPAAATDMAQALYDAGIAAFNSRNYSGALNSFEDFIKTYGKHKLISNAWFWSGECKFQLGDYPGAVLDYEQVIKKYPKSGKIVSCYLKQGISFIRADKKDAAKIRLRELIKKYPNSPEATRARTIIKEQKL